MLIYSRPPLPRLAVSPYHISLSLHLKIFFFSLEEEYCDFCWDKDLLASMIPLCRNKPSSITVSLHAHLPTGFRLIGDTAAGNTRPALFSETGGVVPLTARGSSPAGVDLPPSLSMASSSPSARSVTPNSSPSIKRLAGHQRKASNGGLDRRERTSSSLMDSLNLDTPLLLDARSKSSTLPHNHSSPGSSHKTNSMRRNKKAKGSGFPKRLGLDYDDVILGLDKRASIRSDPGDREHRGKGRGGKYVGESSHTSPTASIMSVAADSSMPINIPQHSDRWEMGGSALFKTGSDSFGKGQQLQARNVSRTVRNRAPINKLNISLPTGPLYKEVVQSPKRASVVGKFRFEYSGGEGAAEGYYREIEASVAVTVWPCLLFEQFDISNTDK